MPIYLHTLGPDGDVKLGTELHQADQKQVLAAYVHRHTGDHHPQWVKGDVTCPVQFESDQQWLANTFFAVLKNGRLSKLLHACESHPTWPYGKVVGRR